jgi:hypothetical protein
MATTQDLWDVRVTLYCRVCGLEETDKYAALMHSDHWPLDRLPDPCPAYCPRCVNKRQTLVRPCGYGRWRL